MFNLLKRNKDKEEAAPIISKDKDGNPIWWSECVYCSERVHYKVSDVKNKIMPAGQIYYYTHRVCANKWKAADERKEKE